MKLRTPIFLKPFQIIPQIWSLFGIYLGIGIVMAQLGILFSLLLCVKHKEAHFFDLLRSNLSAGNFYTFSISLAASAVVPYLIEYLNPDKEIKFKHFKILTSLILLIPLMLPMTFFYSDIVLNSIPGGCLASGQKIDWLQLALYASTMVICVYAFCVSYLHLDESYDELDNANLIRLRKSVASTSGKDSKHNNI